MEKITEMIVPHNCEYSIYVIRNDANGKHYVGQTYRYPLERIDGHVQAARRGVDYAFYRAIRVYGLDNFSLVHTEHCPKERAKAAEEAMMDKYNSLVPSGYNVRRKGVVQERHWGGGPQAEETKRKTAEAKRGLYVGEDNPFYGKKHTTESRQKMSETTKKQWAALPETTKTVWSKKSAIARVGHEVSEETRKKISKALKGRKPKPDGL
jgi:group I intron endonuclease